VDACVFVNCLPTFGPEFGVWENFASLFAMMQNTNGCFCFCLQAAICGHFKAGQGIIIKLWAKENLSFSQG